MNRDNLQKANKVNEELKKIEAQIAYLMDGANIEPFIKYKSYSHIPIALTPEVQKVLNVLALDTLNSKLAALTAELEAL